MNFLTVQTPYISLDNIQINLTNIKLKSILIISGICTINFCITKDPLWFKEAIRILFISLKENNNKLYSSSEKESSIKFWIGCVPNSSIQSSLIVLVNSLSILILCSLLQILNKSEQK